MTCKINVYKHQNNFLVWDSNDIAKLRIEFRIIGNLIGSLPKIPRQNLQLSRPLLLSKEEVFLLIKKKICFIYKDEQKLMIPRNEDILCFKEKQQSNYDEQNIISRDLRKKELKLLKPKIEKGLVQKERKCNSNIDKSKIDEIVNNRILELESSIPNMSEEMQLIQIPTISDALNKSIKTEVTDYSNEICFDNLIDETKCLVFQYLYNRGLFLTNGSKFGADFLAYEGEPSRFHAHYIVVCFSSFERISNQLIATYSRLATVVKKTVLLSYLDIQKNVMFLSLNWAGIS